MPAVFLPFLNFLLFKNLKTRRRRCRRVPACGFIETTSSTPSLLGRVAQSTSRLLTPSSAVSSHFNTLPSVSRALSYWFPVSFNEEFSGSKVSAMVTCPLYNTEKNGWGRKPDDWTLHVGSCSFAPARVSTGVISPPSSPISSLRIRRASISSTDSGEF